MDDMYRQFMDSLTMTDGDSQESFSQVFENLLSMDDQQFKLVAPMVAQNWENTINDSNNKLLIIQMLHANGMKSEDLTNIFFNLMTVTDNTPNLSTTKKDWVKQICAMYINTINSIDGLAGRTIIVPTKTDAGVNLPSYASDGAAAVDIIANEDIEIQPGETVMVHTGLYFAIPTGFAALVQPRSGLSKKTHLRIPNTPGLIDSDYRGELIVLVENSEARVKDIKILPDGKLVPEFGSPINIAKGDRFAQMRFVEVPRAILIPAEELTETLRGAGGFGSTGK